MLLLLIIQLNNNIVMLQNLMFKTKNLQDKSVSKIIIINLIYLLKIGSMEVQHKLNIKAYYLNTQLNII
jgi:hypothetical protein